MEHIWCFTRKFVVYLPPYLFTFHPTHLLSSLPIYFPPYTLTHLPSTLPVYLPPYPSTFHPTRLLSTLHIYLALRWHFWMRPSLPLHLSWEVGDGKELLPKLIHEAPLSGQKSTFQFEWSWGQMVQYPGLEC